MSTRFVKSITVVLLCAGLVGCSSNKNRANYGMNGYEDSTYAQNADGAPNFAGKNLSEQDKELLSQRVFYFDYDRSELSATDRDIIDAHARYLKNYPQSRIRIEGHTDERGTREYNIALGERRGQSVAMELQSMGIPSQQIAVVSYGKEQPVALGHSEVDWAQNRRAIISYEAS